MTTDPNEKVLEAQIKSLEAEVSGTQQSIEGLELKLAALSEAAAEKRREVQTAYRGKHAKRFADIDPAKALSGMPSIHTVKVFDVSYALRVPNGDRQRNALMFCNDPTTKGKDDVVIDHGPVAAHERILLAWLDSFTMKDQKRDLAAVQPAMRLEIIRKMPPVLAGQLAGECDMLETYLNVVLELELGNSSPTP